MKENLKWNKYNNWRDGEKGKDTFHCPGRGILTGCSWNDAIWSTVLHYVHQKIQKQSESLKNNITHITHLKEPDPLVTEQFSVSLQSETVETFWSPYVVGENDLHFVLNIYIYKTCTQNYSYLWLPRLFAFWYFFMLLALSGQQIISV